jgi:hypothetical protein
MIVSPAPVIIPIPNVATIAAATGCFLNQACILLLVDPLFF